RGHKRALVTVAILSPLAYVLVLFAMQQAPVALVAPVRETSIIIGTLLAWWFFGEENIGIKLAGALVVVTGIGFIALGWRRCVSGAGRAAVWSRGPPGPGTGRGRARPARARRAWWRRSRRRRERR